MTPTQLEAAMRRARVGQYENMTGKPYPYKSRLEEAEAILADLGPAPNVEACTCDRDDDSWVGEPVEMPLCPYHERLLRHLSWESLACLVIDYEAALAAAEPAKEGAER